MLAMVFASLVSSWGYAIECGSVPTDGCTISQNTVFQKNTYALQNVISFVDDAHDINLDCGGSTIKRTDAGGTFPTGIKSNYGRNIIIKNCNLEGYAADIHLWYPTNMIVRNCNITKGVASEGKGVWIEKGVNNKIIECRIVNTEYGIDLWREYAIGKI